MKWAKLFKPNRKKIIVFIALFLLSFFPITNNFWTTYSGFPFAFTTSGEAGLSYDYLHLLYNMIFWYVISCSVLDIYEKVKKK